MEGHNFQKKNEKKKDNYNLQRLSNDDHLHSPVVDSLIQLCNDLPAKKKQLSHDDYANIKVLTEQLWNAIEGFGRLLCKANSAALGEDFRYTGMGSLGMLFMKVKQAPNVPVRFQKDLEEFVTDSSCQYQRIVEARNSCMHGDSTPKMGSLDNALGFGSWLLVLGVQKTSSNIDPVGNESVKQPPTKQKQAHGGTQAASKQNKNVVEFRDVGTEGEKYHIQCRHSGKFLQATKAGFIQVDRGNMNKRNDRNIFLFQLDAKKSNLRLILCESDGSEIMYEVNENGNTARVQIEPLENEISGYFRLKVPGKGYLEVINYSSVSGAKLGFINEQLSSQNQQFRFFPLWN